MMNHAGILSHVRSLIKLKQQEEIIESSIESFLMTMKVDFDILQDILQQRRSDNIKRKESIVSLRNSMSDITSDFNTVETVINQLNECGKIDVEKCKSRLISLSRRINDFEPSAELESLENEQKGMEKFLNEFVVSMGNYDSKKNVQEIRIGKQLARSKIDESDLINYEDIKHFNVLIAKTGHYQYWKEQDHMFFLKVRRKCHSIPAIVSEIQRKFPDLSAERIVNHEAWYKVYLKLREKQRNSVKEWRQRKELEKKDKLDSIKVVENYADSSKTTRSKLGESKQAENFNQSSMNNKFPGDKVYGNEAKKKASIQRWKIEKEDAKNADEELLKNQTQAKHEWREKQFLLRAVEIKNAVEKYREQKISAKLKNSGNSVCEKVFKSPLLIKCFRQEDEKYMKKRKEFLKSKDNKNEACRKNLLTPHKNDGDSTLFNTTRIWEEKCKPEPQNPQIPKAVLYIKDIPKLSTYHGRNQESSVFSNDKL